MISKLIVFTALTACLLNLQTIEARPRYKRSAEVSAEEQWEQLKEAIDANNEVIEEALNFMDDDEDDEFTSFPFYQKFAESTQKSVKRVESDLKTWVEGLEEKIKAGEDFPSVAALEETYEEILLRNSEKLKSELHNAIKNDPIVTESEKLAKSLEAFVEAYSGLSFKYFGVLFKEEIEHPQEIKVLDKIDVDDAVSENGDINSDAISDALEEQHVDKETQEKVLKLVKELSEVLHQFKSDIEKAGEKITASLSDEE